MKNLLVRWLPAVLMMTLIFAFSSIPSTAMPNFNWADLLVKKGGHMLGYALLAVALWWALRSAARRRELAWLLAALYAVSDEFHQYFVPGRHASPVDVLIDAFGAAVGLMVVAWILRRKNDPR